MLRKCFVTAISTFAVAVVIMYCTIASLHVHCMIFSTKMSINIFFIDIDLAVVRHANQTIEPVLHCPIQPFLCCLSLSFTQPSALRGLFVNCS